MRERIVPYLRMLVNEFLHQTLTLLILHDHDFNPSLLEIALAADERFVLANDDPGNFVHYAGTSAHIARRQGSVHRRPFVGFCWKTPGIFQGGDLGLNAISAGGRTQRQKITVV